MPRIAALVAGLVVGWCGISEAQIPPREPITLGDGRLVVSGEVSAALGPRDPAFFNYTDYEQDALRRVRLGVSVSLSLGARVAVLGDVRSETGRPFDVDALFLRVHPWTSRSIDIQAGRVPPTFGAFSRRRYSTDNVLIGYPLLYQYLTSLRSDAIPANADDLLGMRGRGWRPSYPVGDPASAPGLPLMSALRWDTGVQVTVGNRPWQFVAAVTNGSLSHPLVIDDNAGKQLAGRVAYQPSAGLLLGFSVSRAAYLSRALTDRLDGSTGEHFTQDAVGADVEYSRDHWLVRAEGLVSRWALPSLEAPQIESPIGAVGLFVEGQYKVRPGFYLAGRAGHLGFSRITGTLSDGQPTPWEFPVTRIEVGGGYYFQRNLIGKVTYQRNWRDDPFGQTRQFVAAQAVYWF